MRYLFKHLRKIKGIRISTFVSDIGNIGVIILHHFNRMMNTKLVYILSEFDSFFADEKRRKIFFAVKENICSFFDRWIHNVLTLNLIEGLIRMAVFVFYMFLVSRMQELRRVFAYHGAEHKTIRCYEAGMELTVDNVRRQSRLHPRCGTSFLLIVMVISIFVFSIASSGLLALFPALEAMRGRVLFRLIMILFKLLLLPIVVSVTYEINRFAGRHDNKFTKILTAPGMWFQNFTTNEPDDSMIEVAIAAVKAVLPEEEGADRW